MHHYGVHAIGHREGLEVALDGDRQWELVDEVHGSAGNDGSTAEVLQAEHCGGVRLTGVKTNHRGKGPVVGEVSDERRIRLWQGQAMERVRPWGGGQMMGDVQSGEKDIEVLRDLGA